MSINRVVLTGNLTRDPEVKATTGGTAVANIGICVNDRTRDTNGNWVDRPNFLDCVMFGKRAEAVCKFLTKGAKVAIEGKLRYSQWERDGQKRSKVEILIDEIDLMQNRTVQEATQDDYASEDVPF